MGLPNNQSPVLTQFNYASSVNLCKVVGIDLLSISGMPYCLRAEGREQPQQERTMKKSLYIAASVALVICLAAFGVLKYAESIFSVENIARMTKAATGAPVLLKDAPVVGFFPPEANFGEASWHCMVNDQEWRVSLRKAVIRLDILSLLQGDIKFTAVELDSPLGVLETFMEGNKSGPYAGPDSSSHTEGGANFQIERLTMRDGEFVWKNAQEELKIDSINISADNISDRQWTTIKSDFTIQRQSGRSVSSLGNLALKAKLRFYEPNLTFRDVAATFTPTIGNWPQILSPIKLEMEGALNIDDQNFRLGSMKIVYPQSQLSASGEGSLSARRFSGNVSGEWQQGEGENALYVTGHAEITANSLSFTDVAVKYGDAAGDGLLTITMPDNGSPVSIQGNISMGEIDASDIVKKHDGTVATSEEPIQPQSAAGGISWPEIDFKAAIAGIKLKRCRLNKISFFLEGSAGNYGLNNITFDWAGGQVNGSANMNMPAGEYHLTATGKRMNFGETLAQIGLTGIEGGSADLETHLSASGFSWRQIVSSLAGNGRLESSGASIGILKEIAHMLPIPGGSKFVFPDKVGHLAAAFTSSGGVMDIRPITLTAGSVRAAGSAIANLGNSYLNGSIVFNLANYPQMNLPVTFKGPFDDISWSTGDGFFDQLRKLLP